MIRWLSNEVESEETRTPEPIEVGPGKCEHCGRSLPLHKRLVGDRFCNDEHEDLFTQEQSKAAIERLRSDRHFETLRTRKGNIKQPTQHAAAPIRQAASTPHNVAPQFIAPAGSMATTALGGWPLFLTLAGTLDLLGRRRAARPQAPAPSVEKPGWATPALPAASRNAHLDLSPQQLADPPKCPARLLATTAAQLPCPSLLRSWLGNPAAARRPIWTADQTLDLPALTSARYSRGAVIPCAAAPAAAPATVWSMPPRPLRWPEWQGIDLRFHLPQAPSVRRAPAAKPSSQNPVALESTHAGPDVPLVAANGSALRGPIAAKPIFLWKKAAVEPRPGSPASAQPPFWNAAASSFANRRQLAGALEFAAGKARLTVPRARPSSYSPLPDAAWLDIAAARGHRRPLVIGATPVIFAPKGAAPVAQPNPFELAAPSLAPSWSGSIALRTAGAASWDASTTFSIRTGQVAWQFTEPRAGKEALPARSRWRHGSVARRVLRGPAQAFPPGVRVNNQFFLISRSA